MIQASAFDSTIYGIGVGRARLEAASDLERVMDEARQQRFAVVFARADAKGPLVAQLAARGLVPLETLVTSTWQNREVIPSRPAELAIEHHDRLDERDADTVAALTADAITISHFHADARLLRDRTRQLYAAWARNNATGRAQRTLVVRERGAITGYLSVLIRAQVAIIDLVAVDPRHHGNGLGSALLASFLDWVQSKCLDAQVGTQSKNRALALYRRFGFVPTASDVTYHLWLT